MKSFRSLASLAVTACIAMGCAGSSANPASPSSLSGPGTPSSGQSTLSGSTALLVDQLAGTWKLQSIRSAENVEQVTPAGANYTLTFTDGRLSTRADCNMCGGGFTLSGQTLTAGPLMACTRAACPTMEFEHIYMGLLSGDSTVTLSDGTLVLSSARGVLRFTR